MKNTSSIPVQYALTGGLVFDGSRFVPGHAVIIDGDRISAFVGESAVPSRMERVDVDGGVIAPGFIDLQLNGCGGVLLNDAIVPETLVTMHDANLKSGCTSFLPTLITTTEDDMLAAMNLVGDFRAAHGTASVLGLHLEGPYINPARKGIHDATEIKSMSLRMRDAMADFAGHTPLMLTLAPECVEEEDIRHLAEAGVVVSLGHSDATYEEAERGIQAGARAATHLFNAMSPLQGREPGMVGALLNASDVCCGMIVDGHHVHYAALALAKKIKDEHCFLVTDATSPVGTDMTEFTFGGQTVTVRDGMCVNADGTLGGSYLTMIEAVANSVKHIGWSLSETLRMASLYPARLMGMETTLGHIAPSCTANLAIFSFNTFQMIATVDRGNLHVWK